MLGVPAHMPDAAAESGGASGGSSEAGGVPVGGVTEDSGGGGGGGANRWPRQETLALLRIRSDMDVAFRDSSLKGPLWDEVSRKMAELGFHRSAKKCKEKFENVYKYHKRTKDGRASKSDGKNYRFFDQLEALENAPPPSFPPPPPRPMPAPPMPANAASLPMPPSHHHPTVLSSSPNPLSVAPPVLNPPMHSSPFQPSPPPPNQTFQAFQAMNSNSTSSSSTSSDEDIQMRRGKKRKWKEFFHRLMKDVIHKQEDLQKKFLETLEKRERDRMAREEAWRVQEMARMNREHELLVQERSIAAAKDAAVVAFLQKVTDQNSIQIPVISTGNNNAAPVQPPENHPRQPPPQPNMSVSLTPPPPPPPKPMTAAPVMTVAVTPPKTDSGGDRDNNSNSASSSRWPKAEVQALIDLRTSLDLKYLESGPKGPLWEEISAAMAKLGYNRSSKRCKEKWENINKYFKKVKESNKKRPEDSKTCPYFHQLEAIYKERAKIDHSPSFSQGYNTTINPENPMAPIMARPEQQWPLPDQGMRDRDHDNESDEEDEEEEDDDDEGGGGGFEIVANKQPSSAANAAE